MRQSRKEARLQWLMNEGLLPERREAMSAAIEASDELGRGLASEAEHPRRLDRGGRG